MNPMNPMETVSAEGAARLYIDHVFCHYGLSKTIVSGRDPRFTAAFFKKLFALLGTKLQMSSASHPQTDGHTERIVWLRRPYAPLGNTNRQFGMSSYLYVNLQSTTRVKPQLVSPIFSSTLDMTP